ncbi:unnamed protein product [Heterobilharzia americana]|nr:unnamed protein product [Heterobilharzia americana]
MLLFFFCLPFVATILFTSFTSSNSNVYIQPNDAVSSQNANFTPGYAYVEVVLFYCFPICLHRMVTYSKNFHFQLNEVSNDILKSAVNRYTYIIHNKLGFGVYPKLWQHDEGNLSTYLFENYQSKCGRTLRKTSNSDNHINNPNKRASGHRPSRRSYTSSSGFSTPDSLNSNYLPHHYIAEQIAWLIKKYKLSSSTILYNRIQKYALLHVVKSGSSWPHIDMDESYILGVSQNGILIVANETWGVLRALETLSQLMWTTSDHSHVFINQTYIEDFPRFKHRGLMLDTSRHFMSKSVILLNLEAMSYNKLNVFHWHMVDDQSFPYQSNVYPELSAKGAYRKDLVYTTDDIDEILEFARFRGIRVIPEFDIPGHTRSVSLSHPEIMSQCYYNSQKTAKFIQRNISLFVDDYVHLGGDEVETICWERDPQITQTERYSAHFNPNFWNNYFWRRVQNLVTRIGNSSPDLRRNLIVWQDVLNHVTEVKKTLLIQVWSTSPTSFLSQGHNIIYSTCWYLDSLNDMKRWTDFYLCDPANDAPMNTEQQIIGGEACMWSEYQSDYTVLMRIWPATSAIAERLWSSRNTIDLVYAGPRIEEQRCRLINRGIPAGVLLGPGYCEGRKTLPSSWDINEIVLDEHKNIKTGIQRDKLNANNNDFNYNVNDNCQTTMSANHLWSSSIDLLIGILIGVLISFVLRNRNFLLFRKCSRNFVPKYAICSLVCILLLVTVCIDRKYSSFPTVWNRYYHDFDNVDKRDQAVRQPDNYKAGKDYPIG